MRYVKVKNQDGDIFNVNLETAAAYKEYKVGIGTQVTFILSDGSKVNAVLTPDSLKKLAKMCNVDELH